MADIPATPDPAPSESQNKDSNKIKKMHVGWSNSLASTLALAAWMILFSAGLLLETSPERYMLSPIAMET